MVGRKNAGWRSSGDDLVLLPESGDLRPFFCCKSILQTVCCVDHRRIHLIYQADWSNARRSQGEDVPADIPDRSRAPALPMPCLLGAADFASTSIQSDQPYLDQLHLTWTTTWADDL